MTTTTDDCLAGECPAGSHHKFQSCRDEALYDIANECDSTGSVEWRVWAAKVVIDRAELAAIPDTDVPVLVLTGFYLVTTNDQGFVYVEECESESELNARFAEIDDAYAEWLDVE